MLIFQLPKTHFLKPLILDNDMGMVKNKQIYRGNLLGVRWLFGVGWPEWFSTTDSSRYSQIVLDLTK